MDIYLPQCCRRGLISYVKPRLQRLLVSALNMSRMKHETGKGWRNTKNPELCGLQKVAMKNPKGVLVCVCARTRVRACTSIQMYVGFHQKTTSGIGLLCYFPTASNLACEPLRGLSCSYLPSPRTRVAITNDCATCPAFVWVLWIQTQVLIPVSLPA